MDVMYINPNLLQTNSLLLSIWSCIFCIVTLESFVLAEQLSCWVVGRGCWDRRFACHRRGARVALQLVTLLSSLYFS
jgi:hypothetical protein